MKRVKVDAKQVLADAGLARAWDFACQPCPCEGDDFIAERSRPILRDLVSKLAQYGSLSPKQLSFLTKLTADLEGMPERVAKRDAERAAAEDCPMGQAVVEGEIVKVKWAAPFAYGAAPTLKLIVRAAAGFKVFGSCPKSLFPDIEADPMPLIGKRVRFSAMVERSDKDAKFGFYKRPTKAAFV